MRRALASNLWLHRMWLDSRSPISARQLPIRTHHTIEPQRCNGAPSRQLSADPVKTEDATRVSRTCRNGRTSVPTEGDATSRQLEQGHPPGRSAALQSRGQRQRAPSHRFGMTRADRRSSIQRRCVPSNCSIHPSLKPRLGDQQLPRSMLLPGWCTDV